MTIIKKISVLLAFSVLPSTARAEYSVYGFGQFNCLAWTAAREARNEQWDKLNQWIYGFVSGVGALGEKLDRPGLEADPASLTNFVSDFCYDAPDKSIFDASNALMQKLVRDSRRRQFFQ